MRQTNTLVNMGTNTIFPADVNFATARIIHRKGRDLATIAINNNIGTYWR